MAKVTFGSKLGLILATAGSAVGLGNIWRFPTTAGSNGGAAFILIYFLCILLLGLPGMLCEFIIGRNGGVNTMRSYIIAGKKKAWGAIGVMGMISSCIILGFYSVVAGWCIYYFLQAVMGNITGTAAEIELNFQTMRDSPWIPSVLAVAFVMLTHSIVVRGVQGGIEKASKLMMPVLFILLIIIIFASCSLDGAWKGIEFLFKPDFSKITSNEIFEALGQAFFSLSLGTACLCTYAAYFDEQGDMLKSALQIAGIDTAVAIMAGLMIFPASFSVGINPDAGPNLIFLTLPNVFTQAFPPAMAYVISILFFALLSIAALTSTISMHEIGTSLLSQELKLTRGKAAYIITGTCSLIGILSALSMGPVPMGFFGKDLFSNFDALTSNILLPLGALVTSFIVAWIMPKEVILNQLTSNGRRAWSAWAFHLFMFLVRFTTPIGIILIFLYQFHIIQP